LGLNASRRSRSQREQGHFPDAKLDSVIQIASYVTVHGERKPIIKNVMTLGGCAPIVGAEVMSFSSERELLLAWKKFMVATDPDWLIGALRSCCPAVHLRGDSQVLIPQGTTSSTSISRTSLTARQRWASGSSLTGVASWEAGFA
jgi:hypothetical protein